MTDSEQIAIFSQIQLFILSNLSQKCVLIIGAKKSGKTSLIKFFNGSAFTRDTNQQDLPYLVQNQEVVPDTQLQYFKNETISLELTIMKTNHPDSGDQVTIIQMPSFVSLVASEDEKNQEILLSKILYSTYVWNVIMLSVKQVHICLITPYQFISNQHKLIQFFSIWEQSITLKLAQKQQLKKSTSIIFTKAEYEDDKSQLYQALEHLDQVQNSGITDNNTYSDAVKEERVFCFLSQDTQQRQGQQLIQTVLRSANFYEIQQQGEVFRSGWEEAFIQCQLKELDGQKVHILFKAIAQLYKKLISNEEIIVKTFEKDLSIIGNAIILGFLKCLSKQFSSLKNRQKQIESQIKNQKNIDRDIISSLIKVIQKSEKNLKAPQFLKLLANFNSYIIRSLSSQILIGQLLSNLQKQFLLLYDYKQLEAQKTQINIIVNWYNQKIILWRYINIFYDICLNNKKNEQLQNYLHILQDITKQLTKKFASILKSKLNLGLKKYQIFPKLQQIKNKQINESAQYKQLLTVFGSKDDNEQDGQQGDQEQDGDIGNTDPRIRRYYYKIQPNSDNFSQIKEKAKKIIVKNPPKVQDNDERQNMKNLLNALQRQPQNRPSNLQLLAKKLLQFRFFQETLEVLMQLANSEQLYKFLNKFYLLELEKNLQSNQTNNGCNIQFVKSKLIPYLQQKATIYQTVEDGQRFLNSLHLCYDFISANFVDDTNDYVQLMKISNEIQNPKQEQTLDTSIISDQKQESDKDLPFLKYSSFTKAQIIESIYKRESTKKKNVASYVQIKKYIDATKLQRKSK